MSFLIPSDVGQAFGSRLRQYKRRERMIVWVGAGLVALITTFAAVEFTREAGVPAIIPAIVPTLVVFGGGFLALARVQFEWAATQLERKIQDKTFQDEDALPDKLRGWPRFAEFCWLMELYLTIAGGIALLVLIWWAALCAKTGTL